MEGEKDVGGGAAVGSSTERQRFYVELKPGETTIVSWKKLLNDAKKNKEGPSAPAPKSPGSDLSPESPEAPDKYLQVEKSRTKRTGLFVNQEKLEHINESSKSANYRPKKRREDLTKALEEKDDVHRPTKHTKLGHAKMKTAFGNVPCLGNPSIECQGLTVKSEDDHGGKLEYPLDVSGGLPIKKPCDPSTQLDRSSCAKTSHGYTSGFPQEAKDISNIGVAAHSSHPGNGVKIVSDIPNAAQQKYQDENTTLLEPQSRILVRDKNEGGHSTKVRQRDQNGRNDLPDLNLPYRGKAQGREKRRKKSSSKPRIEKIVHGEASSVAQPRAMPQGLIADTNGLVLTPLKRMISTAPIVDQHLTGPAKMSSPPPEVCYVDLLKLEKLELLGEPPTKQQPQFGSKAKKLSLKGEKDSNKSYKRGVEHHHKSAAPLPKP